MVSKFRSTTLPPQALKAQVQNETRSKQHEMDLRLEEALAEQRRLCVSIEQQIQQAELTRTLGVQLRDLEDKLQALEIENSSLRSKLSGAPEPQSKAGAVAAPPPTRFIFTKLLSNIDSALPGSDQGGSNVRGATGKDTGQGGEEEEQSQGFA